MARGSLRKLLQQFSQAVCTSPHHFAGEVRVAPELKFSGVADWGYRSSPDFQSGEPGLNPRLQPLREHAQSTKKRKAGSDVEIPQKSDAFPIAAWRERNLSDLH